MIKIENVDVQGIARAVYSARNAMNSWDKSDSNLEKDILGNADLELAKKAFSAPRKKLVKNLSSFYSVNELKSALGELGLSLDSRPSGPALIMWQKLYEILQK